MAEAIVGPLLIKLKDVALTEAQALAEVGREIEKLSDKLMWLQALVHEADLRSRHDGNRLVRVLACQIREVAFEAEDAVDEFYLIGCLSRRFALTQRFGRNWVRASAEFIVNFRRHLCVRLVLSSRIQSMNARLEEIINNNSKYRMADGSTADGKTWRASRTIPHMRDDWENLAPFNVKVCEERVEKLVKKLKDSEDLIEVIRIVGVGGTGRRALLMYVYEEESIKHHFEVRVCVSLPVGISEMRIIVEEIKRKLRIVKHIKKKYSKESSGSRCLVVIHSPISMITWSKVQDELLQLKLGKGSKILLPWREMQKENDESILELGLLDKDHSKTLFSHVYDHGRKIGTKYEAKEMNRIHKNIMEITNGLPLAVVLLAKLMRTTDLSKWGATSQYLMSHDEDTKLKKILSICIDNLPDELKSCLLYTAGFPESRNIDAHKLVRLWMAEGFLTRQMGLEAEQLGQCYLKELIYRGLLQLVKKTSGADGGLVESVAINDQIHPLLRLEAQHISFMDFHYGGHMPPRANTRRLALYKDSDKFSASRRCLDKLRTALSFSCEDESSSNNSKDQEAKSSWKEHTSLMRKLLRGSPFLRVVDLEGCPSNETELPHEIEEMVHLQYLRVRWGSLEKVPSSIGNLCKLQTLDVRGTKVKKLPKSLWKSKTLRHVLGDGLIFPRSTGDMELMQTLETVTIHNNQEEHRSCKPCSSGKRSREQSGLRLLHRLGIVEMEHCQPQDLQAILMDLGDQLESLSLSGDPIRMELLSGAISLSTARARLSHMASLELRGELRPPHNPDDEKLFHSCLPVYLSNLTRLVLQATKINQEFIHAIAKLPILAELEMQKGSYQGEEVTFCDSHGFRRLTVLRLANLVTLQSVFMLHSADNRRKGAIEPIFVDMDMAKAAAKGEDDLIRSSNRTHCCTFCKVAHSKVQAYVWQRPGRKTPCHHKETTTRQMQVRIKAACRVRRPGR